MQPTSPIANLTIASFLDQLASSAPTPGGGAAAALVGAMGAALISMVCNLTIGRPRYRPVEDLMRRILTQSEQTRQRLLELAEEDARAYGEVAAAYRLPRTTEAEQTRRTEAIQQALRRAAAPPREVMQQCRSLVPLCLEVAAHGNTTVVSDAGVATELVVAGIQGAILNVRVNLAELRDRAFVEQCEAEITSVESGLVEERDRAIAIVRAKLAPRARA